MAEPAVVEVTNLTEFFQAGLKEAARAQQLQLSTDTECYLVNLLSRYAHTEALFEAEPGGNLRTPLLAALLSRALSCTRGSERERTLQRLGDVALFWAGFFAHGFARKLVDVDYYVAMGGRAYGSLADDAHTPGLAPVRPVFAELAAKFVTVVDALNELAEPSRVPSSDDLLRYYEIWQKTGSRRARGKLVALGIVPIAGTFGLAAH